MIYPWASATRAPRFADIPTHETDPSRDATRGRARSLHPRFVNAQVPKTNRTCALREGRPIRVLKNKKDVIASDRRERSNLDFRSRKYKIASSLRSPGLARRLSRTPKE
jgi:hypothetical protein